MVWQGPGCPRSTQADRARQRGLRNARRICLKFEAAHLRVLAEDVASRGPCCSLRIQYLADNANLLHQGLPPFYQLILYGEPGYFDDNGLT
jgi:hypothetical protein